VKLPTDKQTNEQTPRGSGN